LPWSAASYSWRWRFTRTTNSSDRNREFEYFQYVNGLLDEETWLSYRQVILINHSSDRGRAWWDKVGRGIVDPEFARLVDELLENAEPDDTYERMSTWADG
jgi:hypothetical protein